MVDAPRHLVENARPAETLVALGGSLGLDCPLMEAATMPRLVQRHTGYWGFNQSRLRGHRYERKRPIGGTEATPGAKQPNPEQQSIPPHPHRGSGRVRSAKPAHVHKVDPDETTRAKIAEPPSRGWCHRQLVTIASVTCGTPPWLDRWLLSADGGRGAHGRR